MNKADTDFQEAGCYIEGLSRLHTNKEILLTIGNMDRLTIRRILCTRVHLLYSQVHFWQYQANVRYPQILPKQGRFECQHMKQWETTGRRTR